MTENKSEDRVTELLEQVVNLLAILVTTGPLKPEAKQKEQILLLSSAGLPPKTIADILGTTPETVSVRRSEAKKKAKESKK